MEKKLTGHWIAISTKDTITTLDYFIEKGYPITFQRTEYSDKLYEWGSGCANGIEFHKDGEFSFYTNVLCSTESSPKNNANEKWTVISDHSVSIKSEERNYNIKIISLNKKKMILVFYNDKN